MGRIETAQDSVAAPAVIIVRRRTIKDNDLRKRSERMGMVENMMVVGELRRCILKDGAVSHG